MKRAVIFLLLAFLSLAVSAQIYVQKEIDCEKQQITYHFKVVNPFKSPHCGIAQFVVGEKQVFNCQFGPNEPISVQTPKNWVGRVLYGDESNNFEINWAVNNSRRGGPIDLNDESHDIPPNGGTLEGFSITTTMNDTVYEQAAYILFCRYAEEEEYSGIVIKQPSPPDKTPPKITLKLSPDTLSPPDGRMVPITATVSVCDNQDTAPKVKLVLITCNDGDCFKDVEGAAYGTDDTAFSLKAVTNDEINEGRVYSVIYSVEDAAGYVREAKEKITVPRIIKELEPLPRDAQDYLKALAQYESSKTRRSMEYLYEKAKEAGSSLYGPSKPESGDFLSYVDRNEMDHMEEIEEMMEGLIISEYGIRPDNSFFLELSKKIGLESDIAFYKLFDELYDRFGTPNYYNDISEESGCTKYGELILANDYGKLLGYQQKYPKHYKTDVSEEMRELEKAFTEWDCACGDKDDVVKEFKEFLQLNLDDNLRRTVKYRLDEIEKGTSNMKYNCD